MGSMSPERSPRPVEELLLRGGRLPEAAAYGAATYFADSRAPRGDRHVRVCIGTDCFVASAGRHVEEVEAALGVGVGERSADGRVSLQTAHCLGYCYGGPAALDGDRPCAGPDLAGQLAGRKAPQDPPLPVTPGLRSVLLDERRASWQVWPVMVGVPDGAQRVRDEVDRAGLRGRGGAGFPTARKWESVTASSDGGPRFVVANGDEGDPGSFADRMLMESRPDLVLEGLALAGLACGASTGYVYVRSEYPRARAAMSQAVAEARAAGHLGADVHGSGLDFDVDVVSGHGSYVAGEETSLLRSLAGLRGTVAARPPYPTQQGLLGRPTAVNNVETLATVPAVVSSGGADYARLGRGAETGTLLVSLNERFLRPGVFEVEFGTPLRVIVEGLGGGLRDGAALRAVQVGGPLGGFLGPDQLDVPLSTSELEAVGVSLGHGGMVAVDDRTSPASLLQHLWRFAASESCGECTPCREGTRRGAADPQTTALDDPLLATMEQASLCAFGRRVPAAIRSLSAVRWG
ncbi:formate dehydrogenase iron-sulfur subunit [Nocardioides luteus]|nr:formate dehydrogenase iron-sulfur subunit [Nocardioides luteus]